MLMQRNEISVMGRRWDSTRPVFFQATPGISLEDVVLEAIQRMRREGQYTRKQARVFLRVARCRVNGIEIPRSKWANTYPLAGSNIEILRGVGKGGGKNPIAAVLSAIVVIAATVATWYIGGAGGYAATAGWSAAQTGLAMGGIALATSAALYGVNALFPAATPKLSTDSTNNSQSYSITGGQNAANPMGFVPLVLGKHRHTPPLGGKSWTTWEGDDQYFNMLVVWGHTDVAVSDFRIGETALGNFSGVEHLFHQATYGDDLKLFAKSYNEQSVGTVLKKSGGWVNRTVGDAEDLSIDIAFAGGLATINKKTANVESRTVQFEAEYKKTSNTEWTKGFAGQRFPIGSNVLTMNGVRDAEVGRVKVVTDGNGNLSIGVQATGTAELWPTKSGFVSCPVTGNVEYYTVEEGSGESAYNATYANISVTVGAGYYDSIGTLTITESGRTAVVKNYRVTNLERASYDIRIRRITDDTDSQYIIDEATWSTMRAILNQPAFNTPIPLCVSELRIKANEQLSGYVDNFNGLCQSVLPDWNGGSAWVTGPTSNPASIMRYLLTTRQGLSSPYTLGKMDDSALIALHEHCAANGYEFNFICDTEETTWSRLVAVLAPARAAPTTDVDGLWGAVIDHGGKEVKQLFSPRNSWGLKASRPFAKLPHALRVKFVDATQDYSQVEQFVYADGYSAAGANGTKKATDIIEWDYPGVTSWEKIWRLARYHLAKILHRPISVTLNTDWEWLAVHRGDLVGVASEVLMNTFGTARIQRLVYDIDGEEYMAGRSEDIPLDDEDKPLVPIGVQLDDTLIFSEPSPARYGIAIRDNTSRLTTYELKPEYGVERKTLYFLAPPPAIHIPQLGALCSVSLLGQEYEEYLLASVTPGDNLSAELTLIPYAAKEIEAAATGAIPPYNPSFILDVVRGKTLPTPVITAIRSDESVLVRAASGGTTPRIAAWWQLGATSADITNLTYQIMATDVETGVAVIGAASDIESFVAVANVTEGRVYAVRIRAVSGTGLTSAWSTPVRHVVVGRTTPPPAPDAVNLDGYVIRIVQGNRPLDVVGHVVTMAFDADDGIGMGLTLTDPYTTTGTFDISPWAGRARRVFVQTVDELGLLSEPVSIAIDLGDVMPDNVLFTLSERDTGWSGTAVNGFVDGGSLRAEETEYLWPQGADDDLWPQDGAFPLWPSGSGEQMSYSWRVVIPAMYSGSRIMVNPVAISGKLIALEYRFYSEPDLWPQNDVFLWPQNDDDYLWAQPSVTDWAAFPENYITHGRETLDFRLVYAGGTPAVLADIETIIDVKDREWAVKDLAIAADGTTHIPLPPEMFRAVTNVQGTLQYFAGSTAMTLEHVPGTEAVGENGFLELGPVIRALNSSRALTLGKANIVLKGY